MIALKSKMPNPLKRYGDLQIIAVYNTVERISSLRNEWTQYVKRGNTFCPSGACPFVPGDKFEYDLSNFLYYRARAITADVTNQNGDLFPHDEIKQAYTTFIGKGIYFNHDSTDPEKAFGIILDAMYTPSLYEDDGYGDKYVEILGAIDRQACRAKRPGLLEDIECGRVTSTSMGTIAKKAKCSICNNVAVNMETLCDHVHPQSPLYMKGRNVFGKKCYETNYGLTFLEDSIVYVPADPTAHMLEVYASKSGGQMDRLADIFLKYSKALGRNVATTPIELTSHFKNTGGLIMEKKAALTEERRAELEAQKAKIEEDLADGFITESEAKLKLANIEAILRQGATSEIKHTKSPDQHVVAPYQETIKELDEEVTDSASKTLDNKIRRLIEEEFRKALAPLLNHMDKVLRPTVKEKVTFEVNKVKEELGQVLPGGPEALEKAIREAPELQPEPTQQAPATSKPAMPAAPKPAAPAAAKPGLAPAAGSIKLAYVEDFSKWDITEKVKLVRAVAENTAYEFHGELELPKDSEDIKK